MSISATRGPDRRKITNVVLGGNENPALFFALFSARKANYLEGYFPLSPVSIAAMVVLHLATY